MRSRTPRAYPIPIPCQAGSHRNRPDSLGLATRFTAATVSIDIKSGSEPNGIKFSSAGVILVAILSSDSFDALTVDEETIFLAGAGVKLSGKGLLSNEEFVDDDDYLRGRFGDRLDIRVRKNPELKLQRF